MIQLLRFAMQGGFYFIKVEYVGVIQLLRFAMKGE